MPRDAAWRRPNPPAYHEVMQAPPELPFTTIQSYPGYLEQLRAMVHSPAALRKAGYILQQLSSADLERKKRCERCCRVLLKGNQRVNWDKNLPLAPTIGDSASNPDSSLAPPGTIAVDPRPRTTEDKAAQREVDGFFNYMTVDEPDTPPKIIIRCKFHPGRVAYRKWTCCNGHIMSKPCTGESHHSPMAYSSNALQTNWRFHQTPAFAHASPALAVALDCEMGTAQSGESELIRLSVIDYFSGAVLLDSLVYPDVQMSHYNTRFSGVTRQAMGDAKRRGKCLLGREGARKALWRVVGEETVVVGHSGVNDLTCLRWMHPSIVDTLLLETALQPPRPQPSNDSELVKGARNQTSEKESGEAADGADDPPAPKGPGLSLKALALNRLGRTIQVKGRGHDSLEDALATRDLLHWHVERMLAEEQQLVDVS